MNKFAWILIAVGLSLMFLAQCMKLILEQKSTEKSSVYNQTQIEAVRLGYATFGSDGTNMLFIWKETK